MLLTGNKLYIYTGEYTGEYKGESSPIHPDIIFANKTRKFIFNLFFSLL